jgi:hypothetical protein
VCRVIFSEFVRPAWRLEVDSLVCIRQFGLVWQKDATDADFMRQISRERYHVHGHGNAASLSETVFLLSQ